MSALDRPNLPSPRGMDRNSPEYRAAVRAAVAGAPPVSAAAHAQLRQIFAAPVVATVNRPIGVAA